MDHFLGKMNMVQDTEHRATETQAAEMDPSQNWSYVPSCISEMLALVTAMSLHPPPPPPLTQIAPTGQERLLWLF
jgi:hypothetical protein